MLPQEHVELLQEGRPSPAMAESYAVDGVHPISEDSPTLRA